MREITSHRTNVANERIRITADDRGQGGSSHQYDISWTTVDGGDGVVLKFQNGPIRDVGVNGVTNEALLAVLIDRMEGFQSGDYACIENQIALDHLRAASETLRFRTQQRERRGVEGTHDV